MIKNWNLNFRSFEDFFCSLKMENKKNALLIVLYKEFLWFKDGNGPSILYTPKSISTAHIIFGTNGFLMCKDRGLVIYHFNTNKGSESILFKNKL